MAWTNDLQQHLQGRRAVVTGSGRGIGAGIAHAYAAAGASVVVTARSAGQLEHVAEEIRSQGGVAHAVACDITSDDDVDRLASEAKRLLGGPIDTLVNNAGVYKSARYEDHTLSDWKWVMDVNVISTVRVTNAFLADLLSAERSRLINLASIAGKKGSFGQAAYNASKHAQIALTRCLAMEYGKTNLRVNAICPGFLKTELVDVDALAATYQLPADELWANVENAATIGRTVTIEEIAALALYLASPGADGMNGQSLAIDGGITYG